MRQVTKKGLMTVAAAGSVLAATGGYAYADGAQGVAAHSPGVGSGNTVQVPVDVPVNVCGNTINVIGALNPAMGNRCANGVSGHHRQHGHEGHRGHDGDGREHGRHEGGSGHQADGEAIGSPGVISGNVAQVPVHVPVNACGDSVNVVGIGNPALGNDCLNGGHREHAPEHPRPHEPNCPAPHQPSHHNPPAEHKPGHEPSDENPPAGEHAPPAEHSTHHPAGHAGPVTEVKDAHRPAPHAEQAPAEEKATELAHTGAGQLGMAGAASAGLLLGGTMLYRRARAGQN